MEDITRSGKLRIRKMTTVASNKNRTYLRTYVVIAAHAHTCMEVANESAWSGHVVLLRVYARARRTRPPSHSLF